MKAKLDDESDELEHTLLYVDEIQVIGKDDRCGTVRPGIHLQLSMRPDSPSLEAA